MANRRKEEELSWCTHVVQDPISIHEVVTVDLISVPFRPVNIIYCYMLLKYGTEISRIVFSCCIYLIHNGRKHDLLFESFCGSSFYYLAFACRVLASSLFLGLKELWIENAEVIIDCT